MILRLDAFLLARPIAPASPCLSANAEYEREETAHPCHCADGAVPPALQFCGDFKRGRSTQRSREAPQSLVSAVSSDPGDQD
jgi:hypothetical protein